MPVRSLFTVSLFLTLAPPLPAQTIDPYCARAPDAACLTEAVGKAVAGLRPGYDTDRILSNYGQALAALGKLEEAQSVAERITTDRARTEVLSAIGGKSVRSGGAPEDDSAVPPEERAVRYAMQAEQAHYRKDAEAFARLLAAARSTAAEIEAQTGVPYGHYRMASALDMAGEHEAALAAARAIVDPSNSAITLIELATRRAREDRMEDAEVLLAEAAALRDSLPAERRGLALSRAAVFWMAQGAPDKALALARKPKDEGMQGRIMSGLIDAAARAGNWPLAREIAEEAGATDTLAYVYSNCAVSVAFSQPDRENTCLPEAHRLVAELQATPDALSEDAAFTLRSAVVNLAMVESVNGNPEAVERLIGTLPDAKAREHARMMIINTQTGRDPGLAVLMVLSLEDPGARLEALARMARMMATAPPR